MPELPDITVYIEALERRILGETLLDGKLSSPFLLRSIKPQLTEFRGRTVRELRRIGKRVAIGFEGDYWAVWHLMIAGRFHWHGKQGKQPGKQALAAFAFSSGTLSLTEAGSRKRASLNLVQGQADLSKLDPGGIDVFGCTLDEFRERLTESNHTLKRALTDPHHFSGIGNAYSDEILHRAQMSPIAMTQKLKQDEVERLLQATRQALQDWVERLRAEVGDGFPEKVTAFREGMAVHGRYGLPCPRCGTKVQRIRHADNETNYCPQCQTGGRLLADRGLSRLLKQDWPRSLDEMDLMKVKAAG